jgi:hypothetical protein
MNRRELILGAIAGATAPAQMLAPSPGSPALLQRLADLDAYENAEAYSAFVTTMIRQIAESLQMPYELLAREVYA